MKRNKHGWIFLTLLAVLLLGSVASAAEYAPGEAIVVLKNKVGLLNTETISRAANEGYVRGVAESAEAQVVQTYSSPSQAGDSIFTLMKSDVLSTEELVAELSQNDDVIAVSPNHMVHSLVLPNDPSYSSSQTLLKKIGMEEAWDVTSGDEDVYVAVIDSGIYILHEDLYDNLDINLSRNFTEGWNGYVDPYAIGDQNDHGTHVSGIIGARGNNGKGIAGVNWRVKIIALRTLDESGSGKLSWTINALDYLAGLLQSNPNMRLPAVNLSLGGYGYENPETYVNSAEWLAYKTLDNLNRCVIVVAAGNEAYEVGAPALYPIYNAMGQETCAVGDYFYPASLVGIDNLIVVGSIEDTEGGAYDEGVASGFSNWSSKYVHVIAPGTQIYSTIRSNDYKANDGTSMAAPHVAGGAALLAAARPTMTASEIKSHLLTTAKHDINPKSPMRTVDGETGLYVRPQFVPDGTLSQYGLAHIGNALRTQPVRVAVKNLTLSYQSAQLKQGETVVLVANFAPENASDKRLVWTTNNSSIATVNRYGLVTAGSEPGVAMITATTQDGSGIAANVSVYVADKNKDNELDGGGGGGACGAAAYGIIAMVFAAFAVLKRRK